MEAGAPKAKRGRGKKNEQGNCATPGNRYVERPAFKQRAALVFATSSGY
jgi:hypothetical protein